MMEITSSRMNRERKTVDLMIRLYCRLNHKQAHGLCAECAGLQDYTHTRLERCPFQTDKPTCAKCPVHCYNARRREQIRTVMRYAGPRMLIYHPWLALRHMLDGFRKIPTGKHGKATGA
jgi:predicted amidophosphoribosyltransferase